MFENNMYTILLIAAVGIVIYVALQKNTSIPIREKYQDTASTSTDSTSTDSYISKKSKNSKNTEAAEGFDILGIENNIKRGKQSNSIPVNNLMRDSDSISPYEGSSFLGNFSPF